MDSYYEYAGASAASMLHDVLSDLGLPLIIAAAGLAWRFFRVAEDGIARPLATHLLTLMVLVWLLRPVTIAGDTRTPRFVQILGACADVFVKASIKKINDDFLTRPFEYERVAALAGQARIQQHELQGALQTFFKSCTANALAITHSPTPRALANPLAPDGGLPYGEFQGGKCELTRRDLWDQVQAELDRYAIHQSVLSAVDGMGRDAYLTRVIQNEWKGPGSEHESILLRQSVGSFDGMISREASLDVEKYKTGSMIADEIAAVLIPVANAVVSTFSKTGQSWGDATMARQRYYLVTAHAPYLYGLILMMLTAFFPIVGLWSLLPNRWTALVNYGKVFISVKLWPVGWALISSFSAHRAPSQALTDAASPGDAFVASTLLYFMIPAFCFMIMHLATTAAAVPFREAVPSVVGASNGPVGAAAVAVVRRVS